MNTANPCCNPYFVALPPGRVTRALRALATWIAAHADRWHEAQQARAVQRALHGLSDATLRDIGMAPRRYEPPSPVRDPERGPW